MRTLTWSSEALEDLKRIEQFNSTRSEAWIRRVEARIVERCASLLGVPKQGRSLPDDLRELSIPDVQYIVVYQLLTEAVLVHRVWSTRQDRGTP